MRRTGTVCSNNERVSVGLLHFFCVCDVVGVIVVTEEAEEASWLEFTPLTLVAEGDKSFDTCVTLACCASESALSAFTGGVTESDVFVVRSRLVVVAVVLGLVLVSVVGTLVTLVSPPPFTQPWGHAITSTYA